MRGGYRPGAGRPKVETRKATKPRKGAKPKGAKRCRPDPTPLEHMLSVMRDPAADPLRRDRMAIAAAPFCHVRVSDRRPGKKDMAEAAARTAGRGSEWGTDLN
jgi:hypothetical protein